MNNSHLAALGWDDWFESRARGGCDRAEDVARVAAVDRDQLLLLDGEGAFRGKLSGKFLHEAGAPLERPCVGDWVWVAKSAGEPFGVVHGVLERKGGLRRKAAGEAIEHQMIAANVDVVFIVQSCHFDFNVRRLERYLVMVRDGGATPCILLTKTDLVEPEVLAGQLEEIRHAGIDVPVRTLSNVTREGVDELRDLLEPGQTYCFVGSSGRRASARALSSMAFWPGSGSPRRGSVAPVKAGIRPFAGSSSCSTVVRSSSTTRGCASSECSRRRKASMRAMARSPSSPRGAASATVHTATNRAVLCARRSAPGS